MIKEQKNHCMILLSPKDVFRSQHILNHPIYLNRKMTIHINYKKNNFLNTDKENNKQVDRYIYVRKFRQFRLL